MTTTPFTDGGLNSGELSSPENVENQHQHDHDSDSDLDSGPVICSVLITVTDHVMMEPSPMEPEEYQEKIQVEKEAAATAAAMKAVAASAASTIKNNINNEILVDEQSANNERIHNHRSDVAAIGDTTNDDRESHPSLRVPVMRIFGPIIRRRADRDGENLPVREPSQSACLYVHGAFPYLLARPVMAGM